MNGLSTFNPAELPPEALEALMEGYRRHLRGSLNAWCEHCLAPAGHTPARHHQLIIRELEDVAAGRTKRLMLFLPPGSAKSTYASVLFPPWFLARHRGLDLIAASHTVALAERFGRQARDMLAEHGPVLGAQLAGDNTAAGSWRLENTSRYYAIGTGGSLTGRRADCLPGNTIVQTISGPCRLDRVEIGTETGYVLAYDEASCRSVLRRVVAVVRRKANELWRIRTASGRVVEATGDHHVFTAEGWRPASAIRVGDVLLRAVRCQQDISGFRDRHQAEAWAGSVVLQPGLWSCGEPQEGATLWSGRTADLQWMRRGDASRQHGQGVFCGVSPDRSSRHAGEAGIDHTRAVLCDVWQTLSATNEHRVAEVLLPGLRRSGSREADRWRDEPELAARGYAKPFPGWQWPEVPGSEASSHEARWALLRDLRQQREGRGSPPRWASHRHGQHEQRPKQYRDPVPALSLEAAWRGARDTAPDPVAVVERVCRQEVVYDIEVEGAHNFFANGILVHNCVVIDDPIADAEEADSETQREKLWDWYNSVLLTRLKPGGRIVLVLTRWHADDLAGRLLQVEPDTWRVLSMPALAEDNDPLGRAPGEPLWDDGGYGYGGELLRKREAYAQAGASRVWSALYQQRPTLGEGSIFRADMIGTVDALPAGAQMVRAWDLAATKQAGSRDPDWTAGVLLAAADRRWVVADVVRIRGGPEEVERIILATAQRDGHSVKISIPQDPGQAGKAQIAYLTAKLAGWSVMSNPETGAKETRAAPIASQCNIGNLAVLRGSWNRAFIDELRDFPSGTHDDMVDALSRAFAMIGSGTYDVTLSWVG